MPAATATQAASMMRCGAKDNENGRALPVLWLREEPVQMVQMRHNKHKAVAAE